MQEFGFHFLDTLFELSDAKESDQVGNTVGNDAQADKGREGLTGNNRIAEAEEAQDGTGNPEQEDAPPPAETDLLEIKGLDDEGNAFHHNPDGENDGKGNRYGTLVRQEEYAQENLQERRQHAGPAVGKETLCLECEDHGADTRNKGQQADEPCTGEEGICRIADADDTEDDKKDARAGKKDFSTGFHNDWIEMNMLLIYFHCLFCKVITFICNISMILRSEQTKRNPEHYSK